MLQVLRKNSNSYFVLMAIGFALIAAWVFEYVFSILPCTLCYYQRYLYSVAIVLLATHMFILKSQYKKFFLVLSGLVLCICAGVAAYQVAIENHLVELPKICKIEQPVNSIEELKTKLATASPPCDKVQWSLFGISIAGYNVIFSLGLGFICFIMAWHERKKKIFTR